MQQYGRLYICNSMGARACVCMNRGKCKLERACRCRRRPTHERMDKCIRGRTCKRTSIQTRNPSALVQEHSLPQAQRANECARPRHSTYSVIFGETSFHEG
eukprot:6195548-Pleurochrysis_carterae.AAC.1